MKRFAIVLLFILAAFHAAIAQSNSKLFNPILDGPASIMGSLKDGYVSAKGSWVALDKHSELAGPSTSDIWCDANECQETVASISVMGNMFTLDSDSTTYKITRWNSEELVAQYTDRTGCRNLIVLKVDFVQHRVFWMRTLSEPNPLKGADGAVCNASETHLELRAQTLFWTGAGGVTIKKQSDTDPWVNAAKTYKKASH